ncbi:MAG TPA: GGDEF domain-containing protein [Gemmatimonadaceae bacterium]|nr:GGDEF domain-containing protein [Gemmatimonadaceae bacterium]
MTPAHTTAEQPFRLTLSQPRWSATAVTMEDAGTAGERLVARVRIVLTAVLLIIPLYQGLVIRSTENFIGLSVACAALAIAVLMLVLIDRGELRSWAGFATTAVDVSMVSAILVVFLIAHEPLTATNSRVVFECYFLAIGATCLRYDRRLCIWAGVLASVQFIGINVYAVMNWPLTSPSFGSASYGAFDWSTQVSRVVVMLVATVLAALIVDRTQRLRQLSTVDRLTGLLNRGYFDERIEEEASRARRYGRPLTVALIDLDKFKQFNDTYGHAAGDDALRTLANVLKLSVRRSDIVARYGGEEFVVMFPETPVHEAMEKLETIRERIASLRIVVARRTVPAQITMSAGMSSWPEDGSAVDEVLFAADERLFAAKRAGRNRVVGPPAVREVQVTLPFHQTERVSQH